MKRFDRIILGVYSQSFHKTLEKTNSLGYAEFSDIVEIEDLEFYNTSTIMQMVEYVVKRSEEVIFALDHIRVPLSNGNYPCMELTLILQNEEYFNKTKFLLNLEEVDKHEVKSKFS
jgi:hypothetical protein